MKHINGEKMFFEKSNCSPILNKVVSQCINMFAIYFYTFLWSQVKLNDIIKFLNKSLLLFTSFFINDLHYYEEFRFKEKHGKLLNKETHIRRWVR